MYERREMKWSLLSMVKHPQHLFQGNPIRLTFGPGLKGRKSSYNSKRKAMVAK